MRDIGAVEGGKRAATLRRGAFAGAALALMMLGGPGVAAAPVGLGVTPFKQSVAEAASEVDAVAAFYRARDFAPYWTGPEETHLRRREALLDAITGAAAHGLPAGRYDPQRLMTEMRAARSGRERGQLEVHLTRAFLDFANDLQSGILDPRRIDAGIKREPPRRDPQVLLARLQSEPPRAVFRSLVPQTRQYGELLRAKVTLEEAIARGGWGPGVSAGGRLEQGASGAAVVPLRDRLIAMGYLAPTDLARFDAAMDQAVRRFQTDHGLAVDGIVGGQTLEALNVPAEERLKSVLVAMERERWMNLPEGLGARHVKVNLTEYTARIYDDEKVTFETRAVIGAESPDRRTPEFSDVMEHMVINPSWYVPRSIIVNEYLPMLRRNPYAVSHLKITDSRGREVSRGRGFSQYSASSFPFSMRQPPGPDNALGKVKFMFPNKYNIYLHDTPAKHLFSREARAYSHGCIRLNDPFEFAYALLAPQTEDPQGFFQARLRTGSEARVNLDTPVPVHLVYRTAYTLPKGKVQFRDDVYGRDAKIWDALQAAGVTLGRGDS
ncbi:L,D-transpeptidase family protein [Roseivivax sp. CAU 1761]